MKVYSVILFASFAVSAIFAQHDEIFNFTCPAVKTVAIDETKFSGQWYEIQRFPNTLITGECGYPNYTQKDFGGGYNIPYLTRNLADKVNSTTQIDLRRIKVTNKTGEYDVYVNDKQDRIGQRVIATDYVTYGIVWGCVYNSTNDTHIARLSIYSRTNSLNDTITKKLITELKAMRIDTDRLKKIEQDRAKCGRNSATTIMLPTIFASITALLLTNKF